MFAHIYISDFVNLNNYAIEKMKNSIPDKELANFEDSKINKIDYTII